MPEQLDLLFKLYDHQARAVDFLLQNNGGFLAYECGTGKTRIVLEAFRKWHSEGFKLLVICPLSLINTAWKTDIAKFASELTFCDLHDKKRFDADIYCVNYEAFISPKRMQEISSLVTGKKFVCCLDESSRISNPKAKSSKNLMAIRNSFSRRIAMSGTPCSQDDTQWFNQISFVRPGILSDSFFVFKNTYFHLQRGKAVLPLAQGNSKEVYQQLFSKGWKVGITPEKREALIKKIKPCVLWQKLDECVDLPDEIDEVREIEMSDEQKRSYKEMKNACITEIKEHAIVAQVALTKIIKLQTICSGFAYTPDGSCQHFDHNPKADELEETLKEIGDEQAVIWVNYKAEVAEVVSRIGDKCVVCDGSTDDKAEEINKFISGEKQYIVANMSSIAHGVTLVNSHYQIFYSLNYSLEKYIQSRARIRRIGQNKKCVYIHLICKDSIEEIILDVLKKKASAVDIVSRFLS